MNPQETCICTGKGWPTDDGHAIDCPVSINYAEFKARSHRLSHSTPGDAEVREALLRLRDAAVKMTETLDAINEKHGTAYVGNAFEMGRAIHQASNLLATPSGRAQGEVRKALEKCRKGWLTAIEFGIILPQHRAAAQVLADAAASALATPCAQAWLPIEDAPRDGTEIVAAIKVRHIKGGMWWERHVIAADEETGELHPDYDNGWAFDDYELWMPLADLPELPAAPPAQDQTKEVE